MFGLDFKKKVVNKPTLPGQEQTWEWEGQRVVYSKSGRGAPLLLLHGLNAAAWGFEYRKIIEPLSQHYTVYLPDLPGFGRSERQPRLYTAGEYIRFTEDFTRLITEQEGQAPAVISASLGAAYVIAAAYRNPELFGPLVLVCPTGLTRLDFPQSERGLKAFKFLSGKPGDWLFSLLTTRLSTHIFLGRDGYYDKKSVDEALVDGFYWAGHQPNAKYAPLAFVTFGLNHSVKAEWPGLKQPVLLVWGREAKITPLSDAAEFVQTRPTATLRVVGHTRLAVYDERPEEFLEIVEDWLEAQNRSALAVGQAR